MHQTWCKDLFWIIYWPQEILEMEYNEIKFISDEIPTQCLSSLRSSTFHFRHKSSLHWIREKQTLPHTSSKYADFRFSLILTNSRLFKEGRAASFAIQSHQNDPIWDIPPRSGSHHATSERVFWHYQCLSSYSLSVMLPTLAVFPALDSQRSLVTSFSPKNWSISTLLWGITRMEFILPLFKVRI